MKFDHKSPILVTGAHRSGSTWVGQVLAKAPGYAYLHEPFNPLYAQPKAHLFQYWFTYIHEHNAAEYQPLLDALFAWRYQGLQRLAQANSAYRIKLWLKYQGYFVQQRLRAASMVCKDPIALFSSEWLNAHYQCKPVILVRHPGAFAYSLIRKKWAFPFSHLLAQPQLLHDHLQPFQQEIIQFSEQPQPLLQQAALLWRLMYHYVHKMQERHPDWNILLHEEVSMNPNAVFRDLFANLQLSFTPEVANFIQQTTGETNAAETKGSEENLKRDSAANAYYWQHKLHDEQKAFLQAQTADIWPHFYNEDTWQ